MSSNLIQKSILFAEFIYYSDRMQTISIDWNDFQKEKKRCELH